MNSETARFNKMENPVQTEEAGLSEDGNEAQLKCEVCTLDLVDCESYCFRKAKEYEGKVDETNKKLAGLKQELDYCKREMELANANKQEWVEKYETCVRRVKLGKALEKMANGEDAIQCVELGKRMHEKLEKQDYAGAIKTVIDYGTEISNRRVHVSAQETNCKEGSSGSKVSASAAGSDSQETKRKRKRATTSAYSQSFIDLLVKWPPTVEEIRRQQQVRQVERSGVFPAKSSVKPAAKKQQP